MQTSNCIFLSAANSDLLLSQANLFPYAVLSKHGEVPSYLGVGDSHLIPAFL